MFTRDNFRDAVNKAIRYSDSFDLAVIIDSSSRPPDQSPKMLEQKIKIYRAFSPGHIEPLLHYGTQKALDLGCSYVVRIDVDEELSEHLLRDIRDIVGYCDTYTLKSLIHVEGYPHIVHEYYHSRIFRPEKVSFNGIIHTSEPMQRERYVFSMIKSIS